MRFDTGEKQMSAALEIESLTTTAASLRASIAARDAVAEGQSADFRKVTDNERARLREVEARLAALAPSPAPAPSSAKKPAPSAD